MMCIYNTKLEIFCLQQRYFVSLFESHLPADGLPADAAEKLALLETMLYALSEVMFDNNLLSVHYTWSGQSRKNKNTMRAFCKYKNLMNWVHATLQVIDPDVVFAIVRNFFQNKLCKQSTRRQTRVNIRKSSARKPFKRVNKSGKAKKGDVEKEADRLAKNGQKLDGEDRPQPDESTAQALDDEAGHQSDNECDAVIENCADSSSSDDGDEECLTSMGKMLLAVDYLQHDTHRIPLAPQFTDDDVDNDDEPMKLVTEKAKRVVKRRASTAKVTRIGKNKKLRRKSTSAITSSNESDADDRSLYMRV